MPLSQALDVHLVRLTHVLQQHVAVLEFLRTDLTREGRRLSAIESNVSAQRLLLQVCLLALGAAVPNVVVVEHLKFVVLFGEEA